jgi:hypothetical protein
MPYSRRYRTSFLIQKLSFILLVLISLGSLGITYTVNRIMCSERWSDSSMEYKYGFFSGCMVKDERLGWIPEDRFRSVDQ